MKSVAIVGFGFCGRLSLFHLIKKFPPHTKIFVFEKKPQPAFGAAFSRFSPHYILNVAANKMSAFSDDSQNFVNFLAKKYPEILAQIGENGFAPREIYGEYLDEITTEAFAIAKKNNVEVEFINEEVTSVSSPYGSSAEENFLLETKSGKKIFSDEIFLATSFKQSELPADFTSKNIIKNLWADSSSSQFHQKNFTNETICLIGSGLTAVDIITGLKKKNFHGKIFVISRRGNFPKKHFSESERELLEQRAGEFAPLISAIETSKNSLLEICLLIRNFLRKNKQLKLAHVISALRPITKKLWQNFDQKNKKLFLRLSSYWNIFRHLAPIASIDLIEEAVRSGQVEIKKSAIKNIAEKNGKIFVQTKKHNLECDIVVNCLGFDFNPKKYPLLQRMIAADLLKQDILLVASNHKKIHLLGGLNIGRDFECTSVPDMREVVEKECI